MSKLIIDSRETFILNEIGTNVTNASTSVKKDGIEIVVQSLPVGDFVLKSAVDETIQLVVERKTFDDLAASILDGRFREQKVRIDEMKNSGTKIMYIIEGNTTRYKGKLPLTTLLSAILNLMLAHEYMVMFSCSVKTTVDILYLLCKKLGDQECTRTGSSGVVVKFKSKGEKINENLFLLQLMVIPGVSQIVGDTIIKEYKSMPDLIHAFQSSGEHMLAEIKINEKRKVGKALSSKIYKALGLCQTETTIAGELPGTT